MIKGLAERLEGMNQEKLNKILIDLLDTAETMGLSCKEYLYEEGTRDDMLTKYDNWQKSIDEFYESFIK